jgi:hypothetical protein
MIGGWVFDENLRPFLETVGALASYRLDEDDWIAIEYGLFKINIAGGQAARRVDYPLSGERPMTVKLEKELGTSVVTFELNSDPDLEARADSVAYVMATYQVRQRDTRADLSE